MKVFSVGCIYFGYLIDSGDMPAAISDRGVFVKDLKDRLERVENISDLEFVGADDLRYGTVIEIQEDCGEILVPIPHGGVKLGFDIYLPFRVQDSVHERCDVENIRVDIIFGYEMPIAITSYDWPDEEGDASPSGSMVIVRKYLQKKLDDDIFKCGCVGPSPFHADFSLIETELNEGISIHDVSDSKLGYASVELRAPAGFDFIQAFYVAGLESIFSKFYMLSELRSRALSAQAAIVNSSRQLLDAPRDQGLIGRVKSWRNQSEMIDSLNSEVFKEMLLRLDISGAISEGEQYDIIGSEKPMNRFFSEYRTLSSEQAWSKFADVAKFFEERRQKTIGNATAIFAGVIGGILGSVIGSLATYLLTRAA